MTNAYNFILDHKDLFIAINAISSTVFAVIGAIVAITGLKTWRKQIRGKEMFEVQKQVIKQELILKAIIHDFFFSVTPRIASEAHNIIQDHQRRIDLYNISLAEQHNLINRGLGNLKASLFEGRAIVEEDINVCLEPIQASLLQLSLAISDFKNTPYNLGAFYASQVDASVQLLFDPKSDKRIAWNKDFAESTKFFEKNIRKIFAVD